MDSLKIYVDRGFELNKKRIAGEYVDCFFIVEEERFPAHKLIVALYSDYLKTLISWKTFSDTANSYDNDYVVRGIKAPTFELILQYMYTGTLTIKEENVFELFEAVHFLQVCNDPLMDKCLSYMIKRLESTLELDVKLISKMWNYSEMFGSKELKKAVMEYIECRFDSLIHSNLLENLGFDEIQEILDRQSLCVRSEKSVCDEILKWGKYFEDESLYLELLKKLFFAFPEMSTAYTRACSQPLKMSEDNIGFISSNSNWKRSCEKCFVLSTWSKDESEIRGIKQYLDERKEHQYFVAWEFDQTLRNFKSFLKDENQSKWRLVNCMQAGPSFYQHYGPIDMKNGTWLVSDNFLFYIGGGKAFSSSKKSSNTDSFLSDQVFVFELFSLNWLRMSNVMPKRLFQFGAVYHVKHLYIFGGYHEGLRTFKCSICHQVFLNRPRLKKHMSLHEHQNAAPTVNYEEVEEPKEEASSTVQIDFGAGYSKELIVSRDVYCISESDWFDSTSKWQLISELPKDRTSFSVVTVDSNTICIVGSNYCDIFNTETLEWNTLELESKRNHFNGKEKPTICVLGSILYIICTKGEHGSNALWQIDLSESRPSWQPWIGLELRFDPVQAFTHNGSVYLMGKQVEFGNFCYKFNPILKEWSLVYDKLGGTFLANAGVLINKHLVNKSFFIGSQHIEQK